jgi:gliding motility-associated-like protein
MKFLVCRASAVFFVLMLLAGEAVSQLNVDESLTPDQMVGVLVGGGVTYSNVSYTGAGTASGKFLGSTNIGIDEGVILTSGLASNAIGPNNSGSKGKDHGNPGDSDLFALSGNSSHDACILEFDFVPQSSVVQFSYVFASEEYPEYAGGNVNDAFGFFISGPGISGTFSNSSKNIAVVPFTSPPVYVSINTINHFTNAAYYVTNTQQTIQYDGFTVELIASAQVVPCSTYHIKLAVGDGGDGIYDSGVFLEKNSFSSVGVQGSVAFQSPYIDTIAVEDCNNATLAFELDDHALEDMYIPLQIGGTAINGVDYDTIPDTLLIPQGYKTTSIDIIAWEDGIPEGYETITFTYNTSLCEPNYETITFKLFDRPEFFIQAREDTTIHCADTVQLYTLEDGGMPPYFYKWYYAGDSDPFDSTANPIIHPFNPKEIVVFQWDACGDTLIDTLFVHVVGPTGTVSNDTSICLNDFATLTAGGGTSYLWSPTGDTTATILVSPTIETTYTVTVYDDCNNIDTKEVIVFVNNPQAYAGEDTAICIGDYTILTAGGGLTYEWSNGMSGQSISVQPTSDECFVVFVTDACDNTATDTVCVFVNDAVVANAGIDQTICFGGEAVLTASGGAQYEWSTGDLTQTISVSPGTTQEYYVTVTDGCSDEDTVTVFVDPLPLVVATTPNDILCYGDTVVLQAAGADDYIWESSPSDQSLIGQENLANPAVAPLAPLTVYTLTGTDNTTTCVNNATVTVNVKDPLMSNFNPDQTSVCTENNISVYYTGNASAGASYDWSFDGGLESGSGQGPYTVSWSDIGEKTITLMVYEDGCQSDSTKQTITVNPTPQVDFAAGLPEGCVPFTVEFTDISNSVTGSATFLWDFGNGDQSTVQNPTYTYTTVGAYDVSLSVKNGVCEDLKIENAFIDVHDNPSADFSLSPALTSFKNPNINLSDLSGGDPVKWIWDMGDGTIIEDIQSMTYTYSDTGAFNVQLLVYNIFGCADSLFRTVVIKPHPNLFAPNAFNPESTNGNNRFIVRATGIEKFQMVIFTRWGEKVFETKNIAEGWDGKLNGTIAPIGTYIYQISFTNNLKESEELTGTVTLIR